MRDPAVPADEQPATSPSGAEAGSPLAEPAAAGEPAGAVQEPDIESVGSEVSEVTVQIGPRFLELFSEHLYSSPNKAFECRNHARANANGSGKDLRASEVETTGFT